MVKQYFSILFLLTLVACGKSKVEQKTNIPANESIAKSERLDSSEEIISESDLARIEKGNKNSPQTKISIGFLYHLDSSAHRETLSDFIKDNEGEITYESETFGYLQGKLSWKNINKLVSERGALVTVASWPIFQLGLPM